MKAKFCFLLLCYSLITFFAPAQSAIATKAINGEYLLLEAERSAKGPAKVKALEYGEVNGQKMLAALACKQGCIPAVYSYQESLSQQLGLPIFFNSYGIYMITYDEESFVSCAPSTPLGQEIWENFSYVNFYSKDADKLTTFSKEKAKAYAIAVSKQLIEH